MSVTRYLKHLNARFDRIALQAPKPVGAALEQSLQARDPATWTQLLNWCHTSLSPKSSSVWHRAGSQDFGIACLRGADAAALTAWAHTFARSIDGSHRLEALPSKVSGLVFRAQVKINDSRWRRPREPGDPWDAGWASTSPPAARQLEGHFLPRRATLILAAGEDAPGLRMALAALYQRSDELRCPLRWLWVGEPTEVMAPHVRPMLDLALRD